VMQRLAELMRSLLEKYAVEVKQRGIQAVRRQTESGMAACSVPSGLVGMQEFQRAMRRLLLSADKRLMLLHWSYFNPVHATEPERMYKVLSGQETLKGAWVHSVHIFSRIMNSWKRRGVRCPSMQPLISDEMPNPVELRQSQDEIQPSQGRPAPNAPKQHFILKELPAPASGGPLLKRQRTAPADAAERRTAVDPSWYLSEDELDLIDDDFSQAMELPSDCLQSTLTSSYDGENRGCLLDTPGASPSHAIRGGLMSANTEGTTETPPVVKCRLRGKTRQTSKGVVSKEAPVDKRQGHVAKRTPVPTERSEEESEAPRRLSTKTPSKDGPPPSLKLRSGRKVVKLVW